MNPLLLPVIAVQGLLVRARTETLPAAGGPTSGTVGEGPDPVRLGIVGESTAAGLGVDSHDEGFPGSLARELARRGDRAVAWTVVGQDGATARRIRHRLVPRLGGEFDVTVLLAGVNDALARRTAREWGEDLAAVVDELAGRSGRVVVPGIPSFDAFPSLPSRLGRYLTERAAALDEVSRRVCAGRATWVDSTGIGPAGSDFFARDGFHPSAVGYRRWAELVADHLAGPELRGRPNPRPR